HEVTRHYNFIRDTMYSTQDRHGLNAHRLYSKHARLEDPLRTHQGNALTFKSKALLQYLARQSTVLWSSQQLLLKKLKRGEADSCVRVFHVREAPDYRLRGRVRT